MLVYATVFVCAYALALMVYRYDMYEKEPWYMLLPVVALGMAAAFAIGFVEDFAIKSFNQSENAAGQAAIAAFFEETVKLLIVVLVAVFFRHEFNDPIDGLIYGAYAGLGFAIYESLFYLSFTSTGLQQSGEEAVRLLLHLLMGGLAGFGLGLARFPKRMPLWPFVLPCGVVAAMGIHFFWNYWCGIQRDDVSEAFQRFAAVGLLLTATALFGVSVSMGVRRSRAMFSPNDQNAFGDGRSRCCSAVEIRGFFVLVQGILRAPTWLETPRGKANTAVIERQSDNRRTRATLVIAEVRRPSRESLRE